MKFKIIKALDLEELETNVNEFTQTQGFKVQHIKYHYMPLETASHIAFIAYYDNRPTGIPDLTDLDNPF